MLSALWEPIHRGVSQLLPSTLQSAWQKRYFYNSWRKRYNKSYVSGHRACLQLLTAMSKGACMHACMDTVSL